MDTTVVDVDTSRARIVDLTSEAAAFVRDRDDGLLSIFVPHATAGVAIFETGAGSEEDVLELLDRRDDRYVHRHGSPGHGADHVMPAIVSPSVVVPVVAGALALGTWQSVVLVDLNRDNPRREVRLSFLAG
jgi:secondary thiamine-phosphate synthase enzyme